MEGEELSKTSEAPDSTDEKETVALEETGDVVSETEPETPETSDSEGESPRKPRWHGDSGGSEYIVGTWAGFDNYGCPHCSFTTLDGDLEVLDHLEKQHPHLPLKKEE